MEHEELAPLTLENSSLLWMSCSYAGLGRQRISWVRSTCVGSFGLLCVPLIPSSSFVSLPRLVLSKPAAAAAASIQSCLTLCEPIDGSPPGSPVPGILQARTLEWVAISFSNAWKWKVKVKSLSHIQLFSTPWTAAHQAPPPMGFSRQEYWSGVPLPSPLSKPVVMLVWVHHQPCFPFPLFHYSHIQSHVMLIPSSNIHVNIYKSFYKI